jgi:CubicO group peptidase (beta-lactamase class C family)
MNSFITSENPIDNRINKVIHSLRSPISIKGRTPLHWTLSERMEYYHVPGLSLAIIDNGQIVWTGGFGIKKAGTTSPVTPSTLFQAASISKPIAATAALSLVDDGKISLDENVNNYLKSWKIPENKYTAQKKVTLRRILSHSAGLTVHGFPGYTSDQPIPTLQQILDGQPPANTPAIKVDILPGSQWRYSGGGFTVLQHLLIDILNEPFPFIMKRLVFEPAGMSLSTYEQPLPDFRHEEAASGHNGKSLVIEGNWHNYPEMAAAGLWTTPTEIAKWALEIAAAQNGHTSKLLSQSIATQMMTWQKPPYGLGIMLEGKNKVISFAHGGGNEGFRSYFVMFPSESQGAVIMTNADQGNMLFGELFPAIAAEYHWPGYFQVEREVAILEPDQINSITGIYSVPEQPTPFSCEVRRDGDRLFLKLEDIAQEIEIYPANANEFFSVNSLILTFTRDSMGQATKMKIDDLEAIRLVK